MYEVVFGNWAKLPASPPLVETLSAVTLRPATQIAPASSTQLLTAVCEASAVLSMQVDATDSWSSSSPSSTATLTVEPSDPTDIELTAFHQNLSQPLKTCARPNT
jgi:hypothetical protein